MAGQPFYRLQISEEETAQFPHLFYKMKVLLVLPVHLVKVEERFQALVDSLLGRTVVVDTVDHALSLSRKNNFSLRLVTLDGELLNPGGAITGGAVPAFWQSSRSKA